MENNELDDLKSLSTKVFDKIQTEEGRGLTITKSQTIS